MKRGRIAEILMPNQRGVGFAAQNLGSQFETPVGNCHIAVYIFETAWGKRKYRVTRRRRFAETSADAETKEPDCAKSRRV
ncbi:hypothetical protein FACS1894202_11870 [Clostridia bacterium]|nr:hypothetical protein FACS1894202_11870 [Clostridia bacterium]